MLQDGMVPLEALETYKLLFLQLLSQTWFQHGGALLGAVEPCFCESICRPGTRTTTILTVLGLTEGEGNPKVTPRTVLTG